VSTISKLRANCFGNASRRIWKRSRSQSRSRTKTATPKAQVIIFSNHRCNLPLLASKVMHQLLKSRNRAQTTMILAKTISRQSCNYKTVERFTVRQHRKEITIVVLRKKAARLLEISLSERHRAMQLRTKSSHSSQSSFRNSCSQIYKGRLQTEVHRISVNHQAIDL